MRAESYLLDNVFIEICIDKEFLLEGYSDIICITTDYCYVHSLINKMTR